MDVSYEVKTYLDQLTRNIAWFMGQTAYKLILLKEASTDAVK